MFDSHAFGQRLRGLREESELTQERLADDLGISANHEGKIERGSRTPSIDLIMEMSRYFSVSIDYLLWGWELPAYEVRKMLRKIILDLDQLEKQLR